ncbi:DUF2490 domain-containing protein [bacterium]|nr:DUF2490 domain-containing protein [candidate division CSSED10-310 bacterium]
MFYPYHRILRIFLIACPTIFSPLSILADDSDWEHWTGFSISSTINQSFAFSFKPETRYINDCSKHSYSQMEAGLDWKITKWFTLSPCYRHVNERKFSTWTVEYRPHLNATFKWKIGQVSFSDRNRLEYRIRGNDENIRYSNKLTITFSAVSALAIYPYIAFEPFYDFNTSEWNKTRLFAGSDVSLTTQLKVGLYYVLEHRKKAGVWYHVHVLGTGFSYSF